MNVTRLDERDLFVGWTESNPTARMRADFPIFAGTGAEQCAVVYMVLEPGDEIPAHTDSAEEVVVVLEGSIEGWIEDERGTLETGSLVLIPPMKLHGLRNHGSTRARALGFFSSATVVSTFAEPIMPIGQTVLGTPPADALPPTDR